MPLASYLRRVIATEDPATGVAANALRAGLSGLAGLYDAGLAAYIGAERHGIRRRERLPVPIISIGNLSVGGTGKTPMTAFLVDRLRARGLRLAVLSRGHGGDSQDVRVVSDGSAEPLLAADQAGDEPVLLARACPGVPVLVGKDRRRSGREALRRWPLDLLLLDDGFQYWQLARDLDIVLLDSGQPFENGHPLPRGLLREPIRNLARAGIVVATRADRIDLAARDALRDQVAALAPRSPLFFAEHTAKDVIPVTGRSASPLPLSRLSGLRIAVVSAIARPQSFVDLLRRAGAEIVHETHKQDHGSFTDDESRAIDNDAACAGADAILMTEKDAVKWRSQTGSIDTYALRIAITLDEESRFVDEILNRAPVSRA